MTHTLLFSFIPPDRLRPFRAFAVGVSFAPRVPLRIVGDARSTLGCEYSAAPQLLHPSCWKHEVPAAQGGVRPKRTEPWVIGSVGDASPERAESDFSHTQEYDDRSRN